MYIGILQSPLIVLRTVFSLYTSTVLGVKNIAFTPAPTAVRIKVPIFPGSCTPSTNTYSPFAWAVKSSMRDSFWHTTANTPCP